MYAVQLPSITIEVHLRLQLWQLLPDSVKDTLKCRWSPPCPFSPQYNCTCLLSLTFITAHSISTHVTKKCTLLLAELLVLGCMKVPKHQYMPFLDSNRLNSGINRSSCLLGCAVPTTSHCVQWPRQLCCDVQLFAAKFDTPRLYGMHLSILLLRGCLWGKEK